MAEARLYFADEARAAAERIALRPYRGGSDRRTLIAYLGGPAERWLEQKRYAILVAERAYARVLGQDLPMPERPRPRSAIGGDPDAPLLGVDYALPASQLGVDPLDQASSRWAVAAAARAGLMWAAFSVELRALPVPWPTEADLELRRNAICVLFGESPADVARARAKQACEASLGMARSYRVEDPDARACEAWLASSYGADHVVLEEFVPGMAPGFAAGPFAPVPWTSRPAVQRALIP